MTFVCYRARRQLAIRQQAAFGCYCLRIRLLIYYAHHWLVTLHIIWWQITFTRHITAYCRSPMNITVIRSSMPHMRRAYHIMDNVMAAKWCC